MMYVYRDEMRDEVIGMCDDIISHLGEIEDGMYPTMVVMGEVSQLRDVVVRGMVSLQSIEEEIGDNLYDMWDEIVCNSIPPSSLTTSLLNKIDTISYWEEIYEGWYESIGDMWDIEMGIDITSYYDEEVI